MDLDSLDHVHLSVPDLDRAQEIYGLWLPGDFTPVCTTEFGMLSKLKSEFDARNCFMRSICFGYI